MTVESQPSRHEQTLVLMKPDALLRGLVGRLLQRFEDAMFTVVAMKLTVMSDELAAEHYSDLADRRGRDVYDRAVTMMQEGPVIALVIQGANAAAGVRKVVGDTFPSSAHPGTIRGDFAHDDGVASANAGRAIANLVHASGNAEEAQREVPVWFRPDEIHPYEPLAVRLFM